MTLVEEAVLVVEDTEEEVEPDTGEDAVAAEDAAVAVVVI
jgi:hypothetical protein